MSAADLAQWLGTHSTFSQARVSLSRPVVLRQALSAVSLQPASTP